MKGPLLLMASWNAYRTSTQTPCVFSTAGQLAMIKSQKSKPTARTEATRMMMMVVQKISRRSAT